MMHLCWRKFIVYVLSLFEFFSGQWFSYILRPRKSVDFGHFPDSHMGQSDARVAIVMQGPIMTKWNFTLETIKMYKMMYPDADLIVSTWIDTEKKIVDKLMALGVHVVLNEYPDNPGISHINYQIVSTKGGIKKAQDMGATHCLKTRTDQRMYRHDAISFLLTILKVFPIDSNFTKLRVRLISISLNTSSYHQYNRT